MPKQHAIGLSKKDPFKVDPTKPTSKLNTITVFADVAASTVIKYAYLSSSSHFWEQPENTPTVAANKITIKAYCLRRRPYKLKFMATSGDGDDDLTITLVYDDGGVEVTDECTFTDVEYDGP